MVKSSQSALIKIIFLNPTTRKLRWRDIKLSSNYLNQPTLTIFIKSKSDPLGARRDRKTIFIGHPSTDPHNPIYWLAEDLRGTFIDDFVFQKPRKGKFTHECLTGDDIRYQYKIAARRLNWDFYPTGHSARNAAVSTLALGGASDTALKIFFNWADDSKMVKGYLRGNLEKSSLSCAHLWQTLLANGQVEDLQKQITI